MYTRALPSFQNRYFSVRPSSACRFSVQRQLRQLVQQSFFASALSSTLLFLPMNSNISTRAKGSASFLRIARASTRGHAHLPDGQLWRKPRGRHCYLFFTLFYPCFSSSYRSYFLAFPEKRSKPNQRTSDPSPPFTPVSLRFTLGFIYTGTLIFSHRTYDLGTGGCRVPRFLQFGLEDDVKNVSLN